MGVFDKILLPDEQILFSTKKHLIIFFLPVFLLIITFFFLINPNPYIPKVAFAPALAALISGLNQFLIYKTSEFAVTNKRILMREGFFFKHTNEMRLSTIANIAVNQSLLGQMLNYGTVIVHAFGGDPDPFMQMAFPNDFQKHVQQELDKIGNFRGPG